MPDIEPPDYQILKSPRAGTHRRIIKFLAEREGAEARFDEIAKGLSVKESSLETNLDTLKRKGFIEREAKGLYRLKFRTPICFVANTPEVPFAYLGLLGKRGHGREECETETAIRLLEEELKASFARITVVTTREAIGSWEDGISRVISERVRWMTVGINEFNDIGSMEELVRPELIELLKAYKLIVDCTSGTRPAGIAYYRLAETYRAPLIYVYEDRREVFWLNRDELMTEFADILGLKAPQSFNS